jgi:hypothetical protein
VVIDLPRVQLQDQPVGAPLAGVVPRIPKPFVLGPSMTTHAPEQSLVPAARGLNVAAIDQRLGAHERILTEPHAVLSWGVHDRWLTGCVVLALSACGGVVRSSPGGDAGSATTAGGTASSTGGSGSIQGGRPSTGGLPSAGTSNVGGQASMPVPCGKTFCPADSICCNGVCGVCVPADGVCPEIGSGCRPIQDGCASLSTAPSVLGCVQEFGKPTDPSDTVTVSAPNAEITSEVSTWLNGGCLEPLLRQQTNADALLAQSVSWIVADGTRKWGVEAVVEGSKIPSLGSGQKVSLTYVYEPGGFGPTRRELSLVTQMSASHGIWTAEGGDLLQLANMPLSLARGKSLCTTSEQCGSYERYDIRATDPLTMKMLTVPHGQTAMIGPWLIVHGGYEEQTSASSCPDWFVADVHVAILGLM